MAVPPSSYSASGARAAVIDALNGDWDNVDAALRRAVIALASEHDQQAIKMAEENEEIRATLSKIQTLVVSSILGVLSTVIASIIIQVVV